MSVAYRDSCLPTKVANSSDEGELSSSDSDESGAVWQSKRSKVAATPTPTINDTSLVSKNFRSRSKNAFIWGSVLTQQSSDDISSSLGAVGMTRYVSRGPESFDYSSAFNDKKEGKHSQIHLDDSSNEDVESETKGSNSNSEKPKATGPNKRKRKQKKDKSNNIPEYEPGRTVTLNRRCELSDTDPVDKVAEEVAFRLWERKRNLIRCMTEFLGVAKTIEIYKKTEDIEKNGGLLTYRRVRRRTPGGTFLHLIRNDPNLNQDKINDLFAQDAERERSKRKTTKKMITNDKGEPTNTAEGKGDAMDYNDVISSTHKCDVESRQPSQAHDGARESNKSAVNGEKLSDGEILDSDGNGEIRVEPETFG